MRRRSPPHFFARLLFLLLLVMFGAILLAPYVSLNHFKPQIESTLSGQLGRRVTVGNVHLSLSRGPALVIGDLKASEDPAFGSGDTIEAGTVRVGLSAKELVGGNFAPSDLRLYEPHLTFTRNSRGAWSWSTLGQTSTRARVEQPSPAPGAVREDVKQFELSPEPAMLSSISYLKSEISNLRSAPSSPLEPAAFVSSTGVSTLKSIELLKASVSFVQGEQDKSKQTIFNNLDISMTLSPDLTQPQHSTHVIGSINAASGQTDGAEFLTADLPFDLTAGVADVGGFTVTGKVGPGGIETSGPAANDFESSITINGNIARFDDIQASLYEGHLTGGLQLDLAAPRPRFGVEGNLNNVNIDQSIGSLFGVPGVVTGHITGNFKLIGLMTDLPNSFPSLSGDGQLSSDDLFVSNVNLSEEVARRLGVAQIGNMAPGTNIGHIDQQFRITTGSITIENLHLKQLDGLGDATSDRATIGVTFPAGRPSIQLDFPATVTLSPEAAASAKQASPLLGLAAALLERSNQLSVPIHVTGDLLKPQVLVDLPRMLQSLGH